MSGIRKGISKKQHSIRKECHMDILPRAMKKNINLCDAAETKKQNWEDFQECIKGKRLFLFGAGNRLKHFLRNYGKQIHIDGVIDNNPCIQGQTLGTCCDEAWQTEFDALPVYDPNVLMKYPKQNITVLITSAYFSEAMFQQMKEMGIEHCYVLSMMEADKEGKDTDKASYSYLDKYYHHKIEEKKIVMLIGIYGSHARQITKALLRLRTDLDIVWIVDDMRIKAPDGVRLIYAKNQKRYFYEMVTAKIWLFDDIAPLDIKKREGQIYIQVKHWGSITLKAFYLDDKSPVLTKEVAEAIKRDGAQMDYLFSGSEFDEKSCRSGLGFRGESVRVGSSRSDVLFDSAVRKKVLSQFQLKDNVNICLYVPTYRLKNLEPEHEVSLSLKMPQLIKALEDKWGGTWYIFVRVHPCLIFEGEDIFQNKNIIDVSQYADSQELVAASNVLITDYSSIMFEMAYISKPVFLYAPDRKEFINGERKLLIDYDSLPFPIAETNEQLVQNIEVFEHTAYKTGLDSFMDKYGVHEDGHASERAAKFINDIITQS